jgi:hypothetical protein
MSYEQPPRGRAARLFEATDRRHVQSWVQRNTPKLAGYAQSLAKPATGIPGACG